MNSLSLSYFYCSSEDGRPFCFCCWSYIIFSTVWRVSPSRSDSLEFSGSTFWQLILVCPLIIQSHQFIWFFLVKLICRTLWPLTSSKHQMESSDMIVSGHSPSIMTEPPAPFILMEHFLRPKSTYNILLVTVLSTLMLQVISESVYSHW